MSACWSHPKIIKLIATTTFTLFVWINQFCKYFYQISIFLYRIISFCAYDIPISNWKLWRIFAQSKYRIKFIFFKSDQWFFQELLSPNKFLLYNCNSEMIKCNQIGMLFQEPNSYQPSGVWIKFEKKAIYCFIVIYAEFVRSKRTKQTYSLHNLNQLDSH